MMQPKRRKPSTGKRKPATVTLAAAASWQAPWGGKSAVGATPDAESRDGASTGEKSKPD